MREVAETMCEEPAVREVYRKRRGSSSSSFRLNVAAMLGWRGEDSMWQSGALEIGEGQGATFTAQTC